MNYHQINNGQMMDSHIPNRLPQQAFMIPQQNPHHLPNQVPPQPHAHPHHHNHHHHHHHNQHPQHHHQQQNQHMQQNPQMNQPQSQQAQPHSASITQPQPQVPPPPLPQPQHLNQPQAPPISINQQYPGQNYIYPQMNHTFVPPAGHVPPYNHPTAASHSSDNTPINAPQQAVNINSHHHGNIPMSQMPAVMRAAMGSTNIHQINNGQMLDPHIPNRLPQQAFMIPGQYMQHPLNYIQIPYQVPYPMGHMQATSPAIRVGTDMNIRQQYDPQNPTGLITPANSQNQPSGPKPALPIPPAEAVVTTPASVTPVKSIKPRERKVLAIVDPVTKHVYSEAELKGLPSTPTSGSRDSSVPRISSSNLSDAEKETTDSGVNASSEETTKLCDTPQDQPSSVGNEADTTQESQRSESDENETPIVVVNDETATVQNGEKKPEVDEVDCISEGIASITVTKEEKSDDKPEVKDTPVKRTPSPQLPYTEGQYSPSNRNGSKKYSIQFLRAVYSLMREESEPSSPLYLRYDNFAPHYMNHNAVNFRDYLSISRRSSQQVIKPRRIITTHSLQQEIELKTAEKPWKPELEVEKAKLLESGEMDTTRLLKIFRGHLNKLTPQKYDSIMEKIISLDMNAAERLNRVIDLVFDKAVDEPGFCELYARLCKVLAKQNSHFSYHLVKKCQDEFETSDIYIGLDVEERKLKIEVETDTTKRKCMQEELYEDMRLRRKKYLGTIKLIGEMYKLGLLSPKIIGLCMRHLMEEPTNEDLECLCSLITTVGSKITTEKEDGIKIWFKEMLKTLREIAHDKRSTFEQRIKFKILDTIDLSNRNWKPRMVENNPKRIEEIREEAKEELMRQQHSNPGKSLLKNSADDRDRNRRPGLYNNYAKNSHKW